MQPPSLERTEHHDDGAGGTRPALVWRCTGPVRSIATTLVGGGMGECSWVVNAEVHRDYHHRDPVAHAAAIAVDLGLTRGRGAVFLTAAPVLDVTCADDDGARCEATVGVSVPTWAAAPDGALFEWRPGTINLICWVPAPMGDAALANLLATATEAKAQALVEAGVPGTGTASDAIAVLCPFGATEPYGGPRSRWGARLARAVHAAVTSGVTGAAT